MSWVELFALLSTKQKECLIQASEIFIKKMYRINKYT